MGGGACTIPGKPCLLTIEKCLEDKCGVMQAP